MKSAAQKRKEAESRQAKYDALSPEDKVRKAKNSPGWSTKQLKRLKSVVNVTNQK